MTTLLNVITHIIIIAGIITMLAFIIRMIQKGDGKLEKLIRVFALIAGFLIYFMTRAVGLPIATLIVNSLGQTGALTFWLLALILPGLIGILVAWYCLDAMRRESNIPARVVILISTFILTLFSDVYVATFSAPKGDQLDITLLPNLTFVIGLSLFVIFNVKRRSVKT
jgi:hypothetical protein